MPRLIPEASLAPHFWTKVDKDGPVPPHRADLGPCWVWTASKKENGYGQFFVKRRPVYAHRYAYAATHGAVPEGLRVLHKCDNPPCVRPDHLFVGTQQDNLNDAIEKGRMPFGERGSQARLADQQVAAIRALVAAKGIIGRFEKRLLARAVGISLHYLDDLIAMRSRKAG